MSFRMIAPVIIVCEECGEHSPPLDPEFDIEAYKQLHPGCMIPMPWDTVEGWKKHHLEEMHDYPDLIKWGEENDHEIMRKAVPNTGGSGENPDYIVKCSCGVTLGQNYAGENMIAKHLSQVKGE